MAHDADAIIVGAGLAGLVAAAELIEAHKKIIILDQEPEQSLGGQAFWSLGGIFLVDSREQRRMGIRDSHTLALQDWLGTAAFDRAEVHWPRRWAEAYVAFAAGEKRTWLRKRGFRFFPVVGWAERGGGNATGHGNSVPRFHLAVRHRAPGRGRAFVLESLTHSARFLDLPDDHGGADGRRHVGLHRGGRRERRRTPRQVAEVECRTGAVAGGDSPPARPVAAIRSGAGAGQRRGRILEAGLCGHLA